MTSAVIMDEAGTRVLLVMPEARPRWSLVTGHAEGGETLAEAARRQVREQTGVSPRRVLEPHIAVQQDRFDCGQSDSGPVRHVEHVFAVLADPAELIHTEPGVAAEWFPVLALPAPLAPGVRLHVSGSARSIG
jgi:ADP-ribose pyrophosphatase YjhB (NUDIX family)